MVRTIAFSMLLACASWAIGQTDAKPGSSQTGSSQTGSMGAKTVQGCLSGSGGNYTLTDKAGNTYQLAGDTSKLTEHVGHEVEIRGMTSSSGEASGASSAETKAVAGQKLEVSGVKHISATCTSGSNTGTEKSPSDKSPMTEQPPTSEKPQSPPPPR